MAWLLGGTLPPRKGNKMSLQQLAEEYQGSAAKLVRGLERIRAEKAVARGGLALELERREAVMARELRDLISLSCYLREYYA